MHVLSSHSLQFIAIFIIKTSVLLSRVLGKKVAEVCVQWGYKALRCVHTVFVPVFQCHALKRHRPFDKKYNFFLKPDFINSMISQYNSKYGQWITTQNVRKKILHALHFKWTILIKYFSRYIKQCQTGTYFFGWVYIWLLIKKKIYFVHYKIVIALYWCFSLYFFFNSGLGSDYQISNLIYKVMNHTCNVHFH